METDKPMAGALSIARELLESKGIQMPSFPHIYDECACADCEFYRTDVENAAREIARYSGMAELVAAVEQASTMPLKVPGGNPLGIFIDSNHWDRIVAAARRVREG